MKSKEEMAKELSLNCCFKIGDAIEIIEEVIKRETTITDIVTMYESYGARWDDAELVEYVNDDTNEKYSIDEIMSWGCFFRLTSGMIISWKY